MEKRARVVTINYKNVWLNQQKLRVRQTKHNPQERRLVLVSIGNENSKPLKDSKLRHIEYYNLQSQFDELYKRSRNNEIFDNLMDIIISPENVLLAYRNIKNNSGSNTPGTDKLSIEDIAKLPQEEVVQRVRKILFNYHPRAVRRKEIPKPNGTTRPLGIPCIWDRIIQQCILQVLEPICEAKFSENSYGFRPNRSCQQAIAATYKHINRTGLTYIVEVDIKGFFDNVNHRKLMKQIYAMNIRDKKLLYIIQQILKAPILLPDGSKVIPVKGTPQGGILSPFLANIVLNELDHWVENQWTNNPIACKYSHRTYKNGTKDMSHGYRAMKTTKLKEMFIVRYADDFRIFCRDKKSAEKTMIAVTNWVKERLKLEVSPEKTRIVNLKRQYSEFLGIKIKVDRKAGRYLIKSHICDKALTRIKTQSKEAIKSIQHAKDDNGIVEAINSYNLQIAGWHNYYEMASMISQDLSKTAYALKIRSKHRLSELSIKKAPQNTNQSAFVKKYGRSNQARYFGDFLIVPIAYVKFKAPMCKRVEINKYTAEGRAIIHRNLKFNISIMYQLMKQRLYGRSIEFMDNRISLYCAQYGRCSVTGIWFDSADDIHCHHKIPVHLGGKDNYDNLTLVLPTVHILIHATSDITIAKYVNMLNLNTSMIKKLNELRKKAGNPAIVVKTKN